LTKKDMVNIVHKDINLNKQDINKVVNLFLKAIVDEVSKGERIDLRGFGTFYLQKKKGRSVFSPITQKNIDVPPRFNVVFKSSKTNQSTGD